MEELAIDRLYDSIQKLSQSIQERLKSDKLPSIKKELIRKITSSTTHKKIFENIQRELNYIKNKNLTKDEETFLRGWIIDNNAAVSIIESNINKIITFQDLDFLEFIDEHISQSKSQDQIISSLQLYNDLKEFAHSGIDEKHFPSPEKFTKKVAELQKFSSTTIVLDKFPKHPSQAIREFFLNECFDFPNEIVNKAISNTKAVFKSGYKKMPKITKTQQEKLLQYNGDAHQMEMREMYQAKNKTFDLLLDQYRTHKKNKKLIFNAIKEGLNPHS